MIVIPENIIYNELETLIRHVWVSHSTFAAQGTVEDANAGTSGFTVTVSQQGAVGVAEETVIDTVADVGGSLGNRFIQLNTPSTNWYFWFSTGADSDPSIPDRIGVRVLIAANDNDEAVAEKLAAAINQYPLYFMAEVDGSEVTVTNVETDARRRGVLWAIFGGNQLDRLNYYDQMVRMLEDRFNMKKRRFEIYMGWNPNRTSVPSVSIMLPNEAHSHKNVAVDNGIVSRGIGGERSIEKLSRYETIYDLVITSDNENEVIILYHFLKSLVLIAIEQFQFSGLQNMSIAGRDIVTDFEVIPRMMYHRTVGLTFYYENRLPSLASFTNANQLVVNGLAVNVNPVTNYATVINGAGTVLRIVQMGEIADLGFILFTDADGQTYSVPVGVNVTATVPEPDIYTSLTDDVSPTIQYIGWTEDGVTYYITRITMNLNVATTAEAVGAWADRYTLIYT